MYTLSCFTRRAGTPFRSQANTYLNLRYLELTCGEKRARASLASQQNWSPVIFVPFSYWDKIKKTAHFSYESAAFLMSTSCRRNKTIQFWNSECRQETPNQVCCMMTAIHWSMLWFDEVFFSSIHRAKSSFNWFKGWSFHSWSTVIVWLVFLKLSKDFWQVLVIGMAYWLCFDLTAPPIGKPNWSFLPRICVRKLPM